MAGVHKNSIDLGRKWELPLEVRNAAMNFQERLLHGVFGVMAVAEKIHCQALQLGAVLLVEMLICGDIPVTTTVSQRTIGCARLRQAMRFSSIPSIRGGVSWFVDAGQTLLPRG